MTTTNLTTPPTDLWIFGYGSLIWKNSEIPHTDTIFCFVDQYKRRAWHGSHDHRGTPEAPGRVVSIYTKADFEKLHVTKKDTDEIGHHDDPWRVYGRAFKVTAEHREKILKSLDHREVDGYEQTWLPLFLQREDGSVVKVVDSALTYKAPITSSSFLGFASHAEISRHISASHGPSGPNIDYIIEIRNALIEAGFPDIHLNSIFEHAKLTL